VLLQEQEVQLECHIHEKDGVEDEEDNGARAGHGGPSREW